MVPRRVSHQPWVSDTGCAATTLLRFARLQLAVLLMIFTFRTGPRYSSPGSKVGFKGSLSWLVITWCENGDGFRFILTTDQRKGDKYGVRFSSE